VRGWETTLFPTKEQRMIKSLISIIVPTYQCGDYLRPLIESTRLQKVDWEMIVVDVGSKDNTQEVMQDSKRIDGLSI